MELSLLLCEIYIYSDSALSLDAYVCCTHTQPPLESLAIVEETVVRDMTYHSDRPVCDAM